MAVVLTGGVCWTWLLYWLAVFVEHGRCTDWRCFFFSLGSRSLCQREQMPAVALWPVLEPTGELLIHRKMWVFASHNGCLNSWGHFIRGGGGGKKKKNCKKSWCPFIFELACKCMVILFGEETSWLEPWLMTLLICSSEYFWLVSFHVSFCCCCNFSLWKWCSAYVLSCLKEYLVKLKQKTLKTVKG